MEPFEISVSIEGLPEELKVIPVEDPEEEPKYQVYNAGDYLGTVWSECMEKGMCWFSSDELAEDTTLKIGEAIERVNP
ncbi:hypothetical protein [Pedobacter sp. GR22-6]|uniref:hypothetical protein n=1 Tax=Pedobacter sp. GR22-6 TaxID=3127957 RepID=UPI00307E60B0